MVAELSASINRIVAHEALGKPGAFSFGGNPVPPDLQGSELADDAVETPSSFDDAVATAEDAIADAEANDDLSDTELDALKRELAKAKRQAASYKGRADQNQKAISELTEKNSKFEQQVAALQAWQQQQESRSQQQQLQTEDQQLEIALQRYRDELEAEGTPQRAIDNALNVARRGVLLDRQQREFAAREAEFRKVYGSDIASAKALKYATDGAAEVMAIAKKRNITIDVSPVEILAKTNELFGRAPRNEREIETVRLEVYTDKLLDAGKAATRVRRQTNQEQDAEAGTYDQESSGTTTMSEQQVLDAYTDGDESLFARVNAIFKKRGEPYVE